MKRTIASPLDAHVPRWALSLLVLPALALPAACTRARPEVEPPQMTNAPGATNASSSAPRKVVYAASWAEYYTSVADLKSHADLAVVGTVSSIAPAEQPTANGPVYSIVTLDVESSPWSRALGTAMPAGGKASATIPATVSFIETGGTYQGVTYEIDEDPLLQVGDRALMFFTEYSPGKYRVTGGPSGRFSVKGGVVTPIAQNGVMVSAGTSESSFVSSVQSD